MIEASRSPLRRDRWGVGRHRRVGDGGGVELRGAEVAGDRDGVLPLTVDAYAMTATWVWLAARGGGVGR
jgi:hypothetical protein